MVGAKPAEVFREGKGGGFGLSGFGNFGLTYKERFIIRLPPEQVKCESLQPLCLDLFQPNGLEHLGGFKAVLRVGVKDRLSSSSLTLC